MNERPVIFPDCRVRPVNRQRAVAIAQAIDRKTKPPGSLGRLETIAARIALLQDTLHPLLKGPTVMVFAGDHGITAAGVSPYPQDVTRQMVLNFLNGGAAINVFARQNQLRLVVVDAGVAQELLPHPDLITAKIGFGTQNFLHGPAMTTDQCHAAFTTGMRLAADVTAGGANIIAFGEMGIGNTSAAAALMSVLCDLPVADCVGRGTGLDDRGVEHKKSILTQAIANWRGPSDPFSVMAYFGGFELAMMAGAMLKSAHEGAALLIDGFCASAAFLVAAKLAPALLDYAFFCHESAERGHGLLLRHLGVEPILRLEMRLGEGTGAAVCFPIIDAAVAFLREMATFETAAVSDKWEGM